MSKRDLVDRLEQLLNRYEKKDSVGKERWYSPKERNGRRKTYLNADDVRELVFKELKGKLAKNLSFHLADEVYYLPPLEDAKEIIEASELNLKEWIEERFDCDDFALVLKARFAEAAYKDGKRRAAHCMGIIWGMFSEGPHAMNWIVTEDKKLHLIEPQTNEIFYPSKDDNDVWFIMG